MGVQVGAARVDAGQALGGRPDEGLAPVAGIGTALDNTVTQLAASVGVAVVGTFLFTRVRGTAPTRPALAGRVGEAQAATLWRGVTLPAVAFAVSFPLPRGSAARGQGASRRRTAAGVRPSSARMVRVRWAWSEKPSSAASAARSSAPSSSRSRARVTRSRLR